MAKYRGHMQIMADILQYLSDGPKRPTRVMGVCNISYQQVAIYEAEMVNGNLITVKMDGTRNGWWHITPTGQQALKKFKDAQSAMAQGMA